MKGYTDKTTKAPILPWSGMIKNEQANPLDSNPYLLGGIVSAASAGINLITGIVKGRRERKEAEQQAMFAEQSRKQNILNERQQGSQGVVPGVANPYMLALGGLSGTSENVDDNLTEYNAGGLHEQNPLGGIPIGKTKKGTQNTGEQGEASFKFDDGKYMFSNRLII